MVHLRTSLNVIACQPHFHGKTAVVVRLVVHTVKSPTVMPATLCARLNIFVIIIGLGAVICPQSSLFVVTFDDGGDGGYDYHLF